MGPLPKTRRDASKSWTGSRRRHNTRKIAIGGTRLDSRLSDFRPATKSAENRECALNGSVSVFVDLRLHLHGSSDTLSLSSALRRKGNTATNGFIQALAALYSTPSFCTLYVYYIRWRAPPFFVSHKDRTMTAARCVRSLMFYPFVSPSLPSENLTDSSQLLPFTYSLVSLAAFFLHHLVANQCSSCTFLILYILIDSEINYLNL